MKFIHWLVHFFGTVIGHVIGTVILGLILTYIKSLRDNVQVSDLLSNGRELISPFVVAVLLVLVIALVVKYLKTKRLWNADRETLIKLGVRLFSNHFEPEERKLDWQNIASDLTATNKTTSLWLLGATGRETFGHSTAHLCDVMRTYKSSVRVLLLRPYSKGFDRRVLELSHNANDYISEILDAIDFCADLKKNYGIDIELKVYSEVAIWKMIITSTQLWLQYYAPKIHVDKTPLYCFESMQEDMGLYSALKSVFQKRWNLDGNPQINLDTWLRSGADENYWRNLPLRA
jgi:hypothetical protein